MNSNEAEPSVHSLSVNGVCTGGSFLPTIRGSSCQCMFMRLYTRKIPQGRGIQLSREALLLPLAVAALMTTALSLRVAVGAGFAAITLAVTFHTVILVDFARAVVFTGTLHELPPSSIDCVSRHSGDSLANLVPDMACMIRVAWRDAHT